MLGYLIEKLKMPLCARRSRQTNKQDKPCRKKNWRCLIEFLPQFTVRSFSVASELWAVFLPLTQSTEEWLVGSSAFMQKNLSKNKNRFIVVKSRLPKKFMIFC